MWLLLSSKTKENEVSVEWFLKLKEIDSLTKTRNNNLRAKSEQESRLSNLNDKRQEAIAQTAKLNQELISINQELSDLEKKLSTASTQKTRLSEMGGDENKIKTFTSQIEELETQGLILLDRQDQIHSEQVDAKTFLQGLEETFQEIEEEVKLQNNLHNQEIKNLEQRISYLMEELPDEFKNILIKITQKNLAHGPFTRVEQGSCYFCRYKISRIDESEIDMQKNLKTCTQCSRIFLPYGA
jgi:predicted  nucleic acid-binding Zn-ribbon protein